MTLAFAPFALDLAAPLSTAAGDIERREGFLVRVDHRGVTGVGEATPLPGWTESLAACETALETAAGAAREGARGALLELDAGSVPAARCGVATALLDADARAEGVPLHEWLDDGAHPGRVPVNATLGDGDPGETAAAASAAVEAGFECLKVKVGARPLPSDRERLTAIREAVGDGVTLRADANGAWSRGEAERALDALADAGVTLVEQPLAPEDLAGHADLRGRGVEIALDEALAVHDAATVLDADAADALVLKPMVLGGPGDAHTIARRARERGIEPIVTTTVDGVVARTAAVHVAAATPDVRPCGLATGDLLASDLGPDPAPVADGAIAVPQDPGLGIDPSEVEP